MEMAYRLDSDKRGELIMVDYIQLISAGGVGALGMYLMYRISMKFIKTISETNNKKMEELKREMSSMRYEIQGLRKDLIKLLEEVIKK